MLHRIAHVERNYDGSAAIVLNDLSGKPIARLESKVTMDVAYETANILNNCLVPNVSLAALRLAEGLALIGDPSWKRPAWITVREKKGVVCEL